MPKFKINKFLKLILESGHTSIYLNDKKFEFYCKKLFVNILPNEIEDFSEINSIDEVANLSGSFEHPNEYIYITPEEEFWGHCSNLQVWAENDYDTCILHSNLSFPLLEELYNCGDPIAKRVFKDEIARRFDSGSPTVVSYLLIEGYLQYLDIDEQKSVLYNIFVESLNLVQNRKLEKLIYFFFVSEEKNGLNLDDINSTDIFNLLESLKFKDWIFSINFYILLKNILSQKNLRIPFLILIKEKIDNLQYDIVVPLIENFIWKTNEKEINLIFKENLPIFHEIFLALTFAEKFKYYFDIQMWKKIGKSISGLIRDKIQEKVIKNDFEGIYKIFQNYLFECLNKQDLISVFNYEEINLIKFLLENGDKFNDEYFYDGFIINGIDEEVASYISDSIMKILPNYTFKEYDTFRIYSDPLFTLGFFGYMSKEHIILMIEDPKIDYFELLKSQIYAWDDPNDGRNYIIETFKKVGVSFKELVLPYLENNDLQIYLKILDYRLWDLFELDEIKGLISDINFKFMENLLLAGHKLAVGEIEYDRFSMFNDQTWCIFPYFFIEQNKEILKGKVTEIIKQKNMDIFVPLYAIDLTRYFNDEEICAMIRDEDINLLKLVLNVNDKHKNELSAYRESLYNLNKNFFQIVKKNIKSSHIIDLLTTFTKLNFSVLMEFGIIEKIDFSDLIRLFKRKNMLKSFLHSLAGFIYGGEERLYMKNITYYENIWPYLLKNSPNVLQLNNIELYLETEPYILLDLKILESFGIPFTIELIEKAEMHFITKLFSNLYSVELLTPAESTNFLHVVGNYLTPSIKKKILKFLDDHLHTEAEFPKGDHIEIVYIFFCLRWNLFFTREEIDELKEILKKNNKMLDRIHQKFAEKYQLTLQLDHPAPYLLVNYYMFIDKESVINLLKKFKPKNYILIIRCIGELIINNSKDCPINQYFRMAFDELLNRISQDFKVDKDNFFNKSVFVHENAEKPCHFMEGCPYGPLVECFKHRLVFDKSSCRDFGYDCPAFYISEFVNENMLEVPPKDINLEKLNDNIMKYHCFNNEWITAEDIEKPCHDLGWCPYGSLGDQFKVRKTKNKYECRIFSHKCPAFYHFEYRFG